MSAESNPAESMPTWDEASLDRLHRAMRLRRLSPWWAKAEIVLGLAAAVAGLVLLRDRAVLGAYLAMAGHRSHLYRSMDRQAAYLLQVIDERTRSGGG